MTSPTRPPDASDSPEIAAACERLASGGLVAFPTETVYGLGADVFSEVAVRRVYEVKGRPSGNPLIVHVADSAMARRVVAHWADGAERLATAFWPGPLSIVLSKGDAIPPIVSGGGPNIAVRCPDHPLALALLRAFGPLVGPSANLSGRVSPTTARHVREAFGERDVLVLDGGACRAGIESTVVSLAGERARVLRPGVIGAGQIAAALGEPVEEASSRRAAGPLDSPGLLDSHYAPRSRAVLCELEDLPRLCADHASVVVLAPALIQVAPPHRLIEMPLKSSEYAARLYAALRDADTPGVHVIAVANPMTTAIDGPSPTWIAVMDRLRRATFGGPA